MTEERVGARSYSNGEVRVTWRPRLCAHSAVCVRGLPEVFDPRRRPWVDIDAASSERITAQVDSCPSGALTWERVSPPPEPGAPS